MRILVTGGAGFLGCHMVESLLRQGHVVTALDNFMSGSRTNLPLDHPHLRVVTHDVVTPFPFDPVNKAEDRFEMIYHMACPASPPLYQKDPIHTAKTCFLGTLNALELARSLKARILLTSTSEVYGDPLEHPQREEYRGNTSCTGIRACYDEGKRIAETLMFDAHRSWGVDIRVARIFNTYGPKMAPGDGRVITNFVMQALENNPLTVYGDGLQTRSLCYVADQVRGLQMLMNNADEIGPVNIGNPDEYTVLQIAETILKMIPESTSKITFEPLPSDDPRQRKPNCEKARRTLGWEPQVSLTDGLKATIDYLRSGLTTH